MHNATMEEYHNQIICDVKRINCFSCLEAAMAYVKDVIEEHNRDVTSRGKEYNCIKLEE